MIYEFMGEIVTEEALEEKINEEVDKSSFSSLALACYVLAYDENANTFDEFDSNNINKFDDWARDVIENEIYEYFTPVDFNDYEYDSEEELEEDASNDTDWRMDWGRVLFRLM